MSDERKDENAMSYAEMAAAFKAADRRHHLYEVHGVREETLEVPCEHGVYPSEASPLGRHFCGGGQRYVFRSVTACLTHRCWLHNEDPVADHCPIFSWENEYRPMPAPCEMTTLTILEDNE